MISNGFVGVVYLIVSSLQYLLWIIENLFLYKIPTIPESLTN